MRRMNLVFVLAMLMLAFVPAQTSHAQGCVPRADWGGTHIIASGENLYRIALHYRIGLTELAAGNCITDVNRVYVGQKLRVPGTVDKPPSSPYFQLPNHLIAVFAHPIGNAEQIGSLANIQVLLLGRDQNGNWVYMQAVDKTVTGWMFMRDMGINPQVVMALPVINDNSTGYFTTVMVSGYYNRLRSGPGFQYGVIGYVHNQIVTVRGRSVDAQWLYVEANGMAGWLSISLVTLDRTSLYGLPILGTD